MKSPDSNCLKEDVSGMSEVWQSNTAFHSQGSRLQTWDLPFQGNSTLHCGLALWECQFWCHHREEKCFPKKVVWHWHRQLLQAGRIKQTLKDLGFWGWFQTVKPDECVWRGPAFWVTNVIQRQALEDATFLVLWALTLRSHSITEW